MEAVIPAFPPGVDMRKGGNASRNSVKWDPAEIGNAAGRSVVESLQKKSRATTYEPRAPMDGRTPRPLPRDADPRRPARDRLARAAPGRAQARRRPARGRKHARQRRHQVPDPVDLVARDVLYRRHPRPARSRR